MFFQVDGDGDEPEVGEEGLVEPVVAGGGPAAVLHAVEDAFGHVPPLARLPVAIPWGRAVPPERHDRRRAERLGRQTGGIPLVRAVHERTRGHRAAPVGRVALAARAHMDPDEHACVCSIEVRPMRHNFPVRKSGRN